MTHEIQKHVSVLMNQAAQYWNTYILHMNLYQAAPDTTAAILYHLEATSALSNHFLAVEDIMQLTIEDEWR